MSQGDTDVDFVRLVPEDGAPPDEQTVASAFDTDDVALDDDSGGADLTADEHDPFEGMGLDFVELYSENFHHFGRLAAILDPDNPDELIDKAFLEVARRSDPPTSRGVALLEVRNALVRRHRNRFLRPRRALIVLPDVDDPVIERLEDLPVFQRDCLVLHHYAAMTPEEIAAVWRTSVQNVDDNLDFAEATFDASADTSTGDVGDRIRRAITASLASFEAEPDVEDFERQLKRGNRKPALIALVGVAAAAVLIVVVALWRADPTGEPTIGGPDRAASATSTTKKTGTATTVPSIITLPPRPGGSTATTSGGTSKKSTGTTTRRGSSGGGGGGGNNSGGGGSNSPGDRPTDTTTGNNPPPPPPPPPPTQSTTTTTTQPPSWSAARAGNPQCTVGSAVYSYAGKAAPGATISFSAGAYGSGSTTADANGNWSGSIGLSGFSNGLYQAIPITISSSQGTSSGDTAQIGLDGLVCS